MTCSSPYTTRLQAGLGLIEESRLLLDLYEPGMTTSELYKAALDSGQFPTLTARRLRNVVVEGFAPRYLRDPAVAEALQRLAPRWDRAEFLQLLLLHTARANLILADFIFEVFWRRYSAGYDELSREDALNFVESAVQQGRTGKYWSAGTINRVASYLLGACADFGLLSDNRGGLRRIQPLRLCKRVAVYLAYDLKHRGFGDNQILAHRDWQLFGMAREDVRQQMKQLSLDGDLIVQSAGEVTQITWRYKTMSEVIDVLAGQ